MSDNNKPTDPLVANLRKKLSDAEAAVTVRAELESLAKQRADKVTVVDRLTQQLEEAEQELIKLGVEPPESADPKFRDSRLGIDHERKLARLKRLESLDWPSWNTALSAEDRAAEIKRAREEVTNSHREMVERQREQRKKENS